jgi:hypothetical protein
MSAKKVKMRGESEENEESRGGSSGLSSSSSSISWGTPKYVKGGESVCCVLLTDTTANDDGSALMYRKCVKVNKRSRALPFPRHQREGLA